MHPNARLIQQFYQAFQQLDAETMASCYHPDIHFSDPAFPDLHGTEAGDMWRMLASRAQDFSLTFSDISADDRHGEANWVATYTFSQTGRTVVNRIRARFDFRDGRIVRHVDSFDLWRWAQQALGFKGLLLGWTPLVRNAIRKQAGKGLALYRSRRAAA